MMHKEFPTLRTYRFLLRQFNGEDIENVFIGLSHPQVIKYYGVHYESLEATKTQMQWFSELETTGTGIWWAICAPDNLIFYGAAGINNIDKVQQTAEIGFWLLPEYWQKGIVQEALPAIINYAFSKLELQKLEAFVERPNENSKMALSKLNFIYEKTMWDCEVKNGALISLDVYAMTTDASNH